MLWNILLSTSNFLIEINLRNIFFHPHWTAYPLEITYMLFLKIITTNLLIKFLSKKQALWCDFLWSWIFTHLHSFQFCLILIWQHPLFLHIFLLNAYLINWKIDHYDTFGGWMKIIGCFFVKKLFGLISWLDRPNSCEAIAKFS